MMELANLAAVIIFGVAAVALGVIDATGADHIHKRRLIFRGGLWTAGILAAFASGWFACRLYHQSNLEPQRAASNKAEDDQSKVMDEAHNNSPHITLDGESIPKDKPLEAQEPKKPLADPRTHKHPTPAFILKAFEAAAPVARQKVIEQFIGAPVSWDGTLQGSSRSGEQINIHVAPDDSGDTLTLRVPIELPRHSFLLQAPEGTHLHIEATIDSISGRYFYLGLRDPTVIELKEAGAPRDADPDSQASNDTPLPNAPTPESIRAAYDAASPENRDEAVKHFDGAQVSWHGRLYKPGSADGNNLNILVEFESSERTEDAPVRFWASIENNNFLQKVGVGQRLKVGGRLQVFHGNCYLNEATATPVADIDSR